MAKPVVTSPDQLDMDATYSVADYLSWQFDEMVQLIKGKVFRMSPAPKDLHAEVAGNVFGILFGTMKRRSPCVLRNAPYDVYLTREGAKKATVVQPDVLIICDRSKIQERGCFGPPDWVCEVMSQGSYKMDTVTKKKVYAEAGVKEYCLIHPGDQIIEVYKLGDNGKYGEPDIYEREGVVYELSAVSGVRLEYDLIFG